MYVIGGIYTEKDPESRDPLAPYAVCFGSNQFYFLFDGIDHIQNIVELACGHKMELVQGYTLGIVKKKIDYKQSPPVVKENVFEIRNSARKNQEDYIIFTGKYGEDFEESLRPYLKMFHK